MMSSSERKKGHHKVANKKDLKEGDLKRVDVDGRAIVLAVVKDKIYAMDAVCSHEGGPLEDGTLEGYELKCPWHYALFDVRDAKVSDKTVWATDLQSYPVQIDQASGDVSINLDKAHTEETIQQTGEEKKAQAMENDRKFYEEEERKASHKSFLKLLAKEKLEGTEIMTFKLERGDTDYSAGQFGYFKLEGVSGDPKGPIRHFSLASSPTENDYLMISTRIRDTPYKKKLASLEAGSKIQTWGPQGEFVLHDNSKPAVFLSGGIGVTPFRSMIKYATDKKLPVKITMFDSNRNQQNILYRDEFDSWANQNKNIKVVYTITEEQEATGWSGERGRIDRSMLERHLARDEIGSAVFYVCGPPGMLKAMQELLQNELQIPRDRLKVETFTGY